MAQVWRISYVAAMLAGLCAANTGAVEGTVVNRVTGEPLSGVTVEMTVPHEKALKFRVSTDAAGEFRFAAVSAGEYTLAFDKDGFDLPEGEESPALRVPAQGTVTLRQEMEPLTTIQGKVLDGESRGVKRIRVELLTGRGQTQRTVSTDDAGAFRIKDMPPGVYLLRATPDRPAWEKSGTLEDLTAPAAAASLKKRPLAAPIYYPNVPSQAEASPIHVNGEGELGGCDIRLPAAATFAIRGRVVSPSGDPVAKALVKLKSADTNYLFDSDPPDAQVSAGSDGQFEFAAVTTGRWHLLAEESGPNPQALMGFVPLLMTRSDREDVTVRLTSPLHLNVTIEGLAGHDPREAVVLMPVDGPLQQQVVASLSKVRVYPGRYRFQQGPREGYYLDSILFGERDVLEQEVELMEGAPAVRIVYKKGGGTVRGQVENGGGSTVVVVPVEGSPDYWQPARTDEQGRFQVGDLRPGDYFVLAVRRPAALQDPGFSGLVEREGKLVHVEAGASTAADIKLTNWPR